MGDSMVVNCDEQNGVLYVKFAPTDNSYGTESPDGIVTLRDMDTDEITGFTIFK